MTVEGVSPYPSSVTAAMVANFIAGGAAISVLARSSGIELVVVDAAGRPIAGAEVGTGFFTSLDLGRTDAAGRMSAQYRGVPSPLVIAAEGFALAETESVEPSVVDPPQVLLLSLRSSLSSRAQRRISGSKKHRPSPRRNRGLPVTRPPESTR